MGLLYYFFQIKFIISYFLSGMTQIVSHVNDKSFVEDSPIATIKEEGRKAQGPWLRQAPRHAGERH